MAQRSNSPFGILYAAGLMGSLAFGVVQAFGAEGSTPRQANPYCDRYEQAACTQRCREMGYEGGVCYSGGQPPYNCLCTL